ncbi:MAG: LysM peptidoglycan-binding domain-containing protein [Gemella haemolysans]|uniref:LysM peptidoglycan-binding domain-containing protein n=1 Tax=Gemella haemolysans TaxID=1379 RepID=UPI0029067E76|nr:LysM peptidoglycan-binding domain-containing protein [Gemella haemolysans]MDU6573670.1 LysM peptidoglycan-binding domain-containing protein [Gemella haemolysans]
MKNNTIKNTVLVVIFIILAPLILVGMTTLGNSLGGKSKDKVVQTTEQTAKVPEETKAESNNNIPKANDSKVTEGTTSKKESTNNKNETNNDNNTEKNDSTGVVSTTPVAGQDYVVKSGDSLFVIASKAYGEANAQNGVEKIKEANNISNNNIAAGQKIQIPKI